MTRKLSGEIFRYTLGGGQWVPKRSIPTVRETLPKTETDETGDVVGPCGNTWVGLSASGQAEKARTSRTAPQVRRKNPNNVPQPHKPPTSKSLPVPPVVPDTNEHLQRAIMLLGNAAQNNLTDAKAGELEGLLGRLPKPDEIAVWKHYLKKLVKEK